MHKKILFIALAISIISFQGKVFADPSNAVNNGTVQTDTNTNVSNVDKLQQIDDQVSNLLLDLQKNNDELVKIDKDMKRLNLNILTSEKIIKTRENILSKQYRYMYMNKGYTNLALSLLDCKSIGDALDKANAIVRVIELNNDNISRLQKEKEILQHTKEKIISEKEKITKINQDINKKLIQLQIDKAAAQQYAASITATTDITDNIKNSKDIAASLFQVTPSRGGNIKIGDSIASYATNFIGVPYLWGGTTPAGFDCSGFVQYCYSNFGISIPRTSEEQQTVGTEVSLDNAKPGDLIFFGSPAHHVGMYLGSGYYIQAPHTGDVVKITKINVGECTNIKRIVR